MKVTDLNTNGGIGANSMLLEIGPYRVLIDAGLDPKKTGNGAMPKLDHIGPGGLDFIILTHCHLDHLGALPVAARLHPESLILCSRPSAVIAPRMLHNSVTVMQRQREEADIPEYPLFTRSEVDALEERLLPVPFERRIVFDEKTADIAFTFFHAGHVAGAAGLLIECQKRSLLVTGDILFTLQRTLDGAQLPTLHVDTLIMETTRGGTERPVDTDRESEVRRLLAMIDLVLGRGGSMLLPVFALGRMQEVMTILYDAMRQGQLKRYPVFASGLGMSLVNYFEAISRKTDLVRFHRRVMKDLKVREPSARFQPGRDVSDKGIYVLSSGMVVENTPSYRAAASMLGNPLNGIAFCGYCDPDTPGGQLLACNPGEPFEFSALDFHSPVKAEIAQFDLSGHADREELVEFALTITPKTLVLTHGDPDSRAWFADTFRTLDPDIRVLDPRPLQRYEL